MQVSQIITDVRRELLETTGSFWSDSELLRLLNRGMTDFVSKTRVLEDKAKLSLTVGRKDYPLPSNWSSASMVFHKETNPDGNSVSFQRLRPTNLEKMAQEELNFLDESTERQARPRKYWIWNKVLNIHPAPKTVEDSDLWLFYKAKPVNILSSTEELEVDTDFAEAIIAYILWKAWMKEQESGLADSQAIIYLSYVKQALKWRKRQSGDQRNRMDIDSPYGIANDYNTGFYPW